MPEIPSPDGPAASRREHATSVRTTVEFGGGLAELCYTGEVRKPVDPHGLGNHCFRAARLGHHPTHRLNSDTLSMAMKKYPLVAS
jgi:hypothetical protein